MIVRFALFALMALGLGGFGTVAWVATHGHHGPHHAVVAAPAKIVVLTALHALQPGALLKPADLGTLAVAEGELPQGASRDTPAERAGLIGAMVRRPVLTGQPILPADVMRPGDHGFLAAVLAPGMRAVTVGVDAISGSAGLIWPGDRVDLVLTQEIADKTLPLGKRLAAETVLSDVRVIAIDQHLVQGVDPNGVGHHLAQTVTLEVSPHEAEDVAVATHLGRLSLVVVAADVDANKAESPRPTIAWAGQVSPALEVAQPKQEAGPTLKVFRGSAGAEQVHF